jgi:hypothetical protein
LRSIVDGDVATQSRSTIMNSVKKIIAGTAFAAVLSLSTAAAAQAADVMTMKPLQALSFDVATKHAVAYFLSDNGACKLVVTLAETPNADDVTTFTTTRFEAAISAGKATRFDASVSKALEFACQADTLAMTVKPVEQIVDAAK